MMARAASEAEAFKAATIALRSRIERVGLGSVTDRVQARAIDLVGPAVDDNPEPRVPGEVDDPAKKPVVQIGPFRPGPLFPVDAGIGQRTH
jgi:hypothetical protein